MNLNKRLDRLEMAVEKHLIESGEIRQDLKWLKKSFWALAGLGTLVGGTAMGEIIVHVVTR